MSRPRKLTDAQVAFARLCKVMRKKYPSARELALRVQVSVVVITAAQLGHTYKHVRFPRELEP